MKISKDERENLIKENIAFIINAVSETTGRYVDAKKDNEMSVGLYAFDEAIDRYENDKGHFHAFAKMVIKSRIIDYLRKENRRQHTSMDLMAEEGFDIEDYKAQVDFELKEDIESWKKDLEFLGISLEDLERESPKHKDTRKKALEISEKSSAIPYITNHMYEKKRLPIKMMSQNFNVSEKIIRTSKIFIMACIDIFFKKYDSLIRFIRG